MIKGGSGMKIKIIVLLMLSMFVIFIGGCINKGDDINQNGEFRGVVEDEYFHLDNDNFGIFPGEFIIDENLALDIGNSIIKSYCSGWEDDVLEKTNFIVCEIKERDIFVVYRYYPDSMGGAHGVAINKNNGAILKIWTDE